MSTPNIAFSENVAKLRARLVDANRMGLGRDNGADFALANMMQLMNEAEVLRQRALKQAQNLLEQSKASEAQANAFSMIHSMAYAVFDGFVRAAEKSVAEEAMLKEMDAPPPVEGGVETAPEVESTAAKAARARSRKRVDQP